MDDSGVKISKERIPSREDLRYDEAYEFIVIEDCDGKRVPTSQVSIPNAYTSLAFVIRTVGFPGLRGRISSGALLRWKFAPSFSGHKSGREIIKEKPKSAMRGVPSGATKMFCYKNMSLSRFLGRETNSDLTGVR